MEKSVFFLLFLLFAYGMALNCYDCDSSLGFTDCQNPSEAQDPITNCEDIGPSESGYECLSFRVSNNDGGYNGVARGCFPAFGDSCDLVTGAFPSADVNCISCNEDLCNNVQV